MSDTRSFKKDKFINPYNLTQLRLSRKDVNLNFDYKTSALCKFGCKWFEAKATCPPNIPELNFYKKALNEYSNLYFVGRKYPYSDGLFLSYWRIFSTNEIHKLILKKEADLFKKGYIYAKAFLGGSCKLCPSNVCKPEKCRIPNMGRAPIEATGLNIFSLMDDLGFKYQEPPKDYFWRIGMVFY